MVNALFLLLLGTENKFLLTVTAGVEIKTYLKPGGNKEEQREINSVLQLKYWPLLGVPRSHHFWEFPGSIPM